MTRQGHALATGLVILTGFLVAAQPEIPVKALIAVSATRVEKNQSILSSAYEVVGSDRLRGEIHILTTLEGVATLRQAGWQPRIIFRDTNKELRQLRYGGTTSGDWTEGSAVDTTLGLYTTYAEMVIELQQLANSFPAMARLDSIGHSVEGRTIWALKISDDVETDDATEAEVLYLGNHHAREVISVEIPLSFARYLLENYDLSTRVRDIVDSRQIYIIPMVNPDGHVMVERVDLMWRKNLRANSDGSFGVDLNRNYGYQWGYDDIGSSPDGSSNVYRGTGPWSEPETAAIRDFVRSRRIALALTYHAYGNVYIYPWGYIDSVSVDNSLFQHLATSFAFANLYSQGNGAATLGYFMNGEAVDWLYGDTTGREPVFAWTVEVGTGVDYFHPDTSRIVPLILENLESNLLLAELADDPWQGVPLVPQPVLSAVTLSFEDSALVRWESLTHDALAGFRLRSMGTSDWTTNMDWGQLGPRSTSAVVDITSPTYFTLAAVDTTVHHAVSLGSDTYGAAVGAGLPTVLIVDGFDRHGGSGSWPHSAHPFVQSVGQAITAAGYGIASCDNDYVVQGGIDLNDYEAVIWSLGDESTQDETFSTAEQTLVKAYLDGGGHLFVSGSEVGWDLDWRGSSADRSFYHNYLKSAYVRDDSESYLVGGTMAGIFAGLDGFGYGERPQGSPYDEDYPDLIEPRGGSVGSLVYSVIGGIAAVEYAGLFGTGTTPGKLVYLAFPFETIHLAEDRAAVVSRVLDWFAAPYLANRADRPLPDRLVLGPVAPNPFNPTTTIQFDLPVSTDVQLAIYDLLGREVIQIVNGRIEAGYHRVVWNARNANGRDVSTGIYIVVIMTPEFRKSIKIVLLK